MKYNAEKEERERREKDTRFIRDPYEWPKWPLCPLKRVHGQFTDSNYCGFLVNQEAPPYKVYLGYIWGLPTTAKTWAEALEGLEIEEYNDLGTLLDKWKVD